MESTFLITTLQLLTFVIYVGYVGYKFGILDAISSSTKKFEGENKKWFLVFCCTLGALNLMQGMGIWGMLTTVGLFFTGITYLYYEDIAYGKILHSVSAVFAILTGFIGFGVVLGMWWLFGIFTIGSLLIMFEPTINVSNKTWWLESLGFGLIILGYYAR